jgi:hypothetical protein
MRIRKERATAVEKTYGAVVPALVQYTNGILFGDVWRRPDLSPRDRSLVTLYARSSKRACGTCFKSWYSTVCWSGTALLLSQVRIVPNVRNVRRVNAVRQLC